MKGIVFTELFEMIEKEFGLEVCDQIIVESKLPSEGIYTSVGTYEAREIGMIVSKLSEITKIESSNLVKAFGRYLFWTFQKNYGEFMDRSSTMFDFLDSIESYIHPEVRKLYPDAELPTFKTVTKTDTNFEMLYQSRRKMHMLALGLIESCSEHYKEDVTVDAKVNKEDDTEVLISIVKN